MQCSPSSTSRLPERSTVSTLPLLDVVHVRVVEPLARNVRRKGGNGNACAVGDEGASIKELLQHHQAQATGLQRVRLLRRSSGGVQRQRLLRQPMQGHEIGVRAGQQFGLVFDGEAQAACHAQQDGLALLQRVLQCQGGEHGGGLLLCLDLGAHVLAQLVVGKQRQRP